MNEHWKGKYMERKARTMVNITGMDVEPSRVDYIKYQDESVFAKLNGVFTRYELEDIIENIEKKRNDTLDGV